MTGTTVAIDIGGTFVDAIVFDRRDRTVTVEKAPTTPDDPSRGVLDALNRTEADIDRIETVVHGTTLGLNAVLERDGARTGIVTTEGFRDVFEIGRARVRDEEMFDTFGYERPDPLVPRRRRLGVPGRIDAEGNVVEPLDEAAVAAAGRTLVDEHGVDAIAVCFLHAYRDPSHEVRAGEVLRETVPDTTVSLSSSITREYREYERLSTTVVDAYIKPPFGSYVERLSAALAADGFDGSFVIAKSGGGAVTAGDAADAPVDTILSGPAGGVIGAQRVAEQTGRANLVTADMGGTSLDASVIEEGTPIVDHESTVDRIALKIPVYDIRTIGAGGGSVAWVDGGLLKVGPKSAGADPGPICYGNGGTRPTVTDAAAVLGYLRPDASLGESLSLDVAAAAAGIERALATPLDLDTPAASAGVFEVLLADAATALREITVERGHDPRSFGLLAFGGAGPMFVPLLGRELDVDAVVVPRDPAVFSARGMLGSDIVADDARTFVHSLGDLDAAAVDDAFAEMEATATTEMAADGFGPDDIETKRRVDMRYRGQEHTLSVPVDEVSSTAALRERFADRHADRYGHRMDDPVETVHLRLRTVGVTDKPSLGVSDGDPDGDSRVGTREAYCFASDEMRPFEIHERDRLAPGATVDGPAIVSEPTTTTVVHGDQVATADEFGHLVITEA
ncbi:hydantoinase/oxoprolinase family protein [Halosimplex sp. TS25]|uniref:hydantoinase/oxoprolinase family protein n=1 Tax=Halosimplex rarum TaxID=3396619 RepID=UPI0039E92FC5